MRRRHDDRRLRNDNDGESEVCETCIEENDRNEMEEKNGRPRKRNGDGGREREREEGRK